MEPIVAPILAGVVSNLICLAGKKGKEAIRNSLPDRLARAAQRGELPENHEVERGVQRAAVHASSFLLSGVTGDDLPDVAATQGMFARFLRRNDENLTRAKEWLDWMSVDLSSKHGDEKRRQHAVRASAFGPSAYEAVVEAMDRLAASWPGGAVSASLAEAGPDADAAAEVGRPLAAAALEKVLDVGGWEGDERVRAFDVLWPRFSDPAQDWVAVFALYFAEEAKHDARMSAILLHLRLQRQSDEISRILANTETSRRELQAIVAELKGELGGDPDAVLNHLGSIASTLERIDRRLDWAFKFMFDRDKPRGRDETRRFHFTAEADRFTGRDTEIALVRDKLLSGTARPAGEDDLFKWMALCGEGGTGKSRLAKEIIDTCRREGWHAGFASDSTLRDAHFAQKAAANLERRTLIVIDYAIRHGEGLQAFFDGWAAYTDEGSQPVRIVLIARKADDRIFRLIRGDDQGTRLSDYVANAEVNGPLNRLTLESLADHATVELMRGRLRQASAETGRKTVDASDKELLTVLHRFDRARRPLFALIVADALQRGTLPGLADGIDDQEEARLRLFRAHIDDQRSRYWTPLAINVDKDSHKITLSQHENLVRLSTVAGGIARPAVTAMRKEVEEVAELVPAPARVERAGTVRRELLREITGIDERPAASGPDDRERGAVRFPTLEPDLIGERHVLMTVGEAGESCVAWMSVQEIAKHAWSADPAYTAFFLRLMSQDYPRRSQELGWLPPPALDAQTASARAAMLRNICADIAAPLVGRQPTMTELERLFALVDAFAPELTKLVETDEAVREHYGRVLRQVAEIAARVINPAIIVDRPLLPITTASEDERIQQRILTRAFHESSAQIGDKPPAERLQARPAPDGRALRHGPAVGTQQDASAVPSREAVDTVLGRFRTVCDRARTYLLSEWPFSHRLPFVDTVAHFITSVCWEGRGRSSGSKSQVPPLTGDERRIRETLAAEARKMLADSERDRDLDSAGVAIRLMLAIGYAQNDTGVTEFRTAHRFIERAIEAGDLALMPAIGTALRLIGNHLVHCFHPAFKKYGLAGDDRALPRNALVRIVDRLQRSYSEIAPSPDWDLAPILDHYRWLMMVEEGSDREALLKAHWARIDAILNRASRDDSFDGSYFAFYGLGLANLAPVADLDGRQLTGTEVLRRMTTLIEEVGLNRGRLRAAGAADLSWAAPLEPLVCVTDVEEAPTLEFLDLLVAELGDRAHGALCSAMERLPDVAAPGDRAGFLLRWLGAQNVRMPTGDDSLAKAMLSAWAQMAFEGDIPGAAASIDAVWTEGLHADAVGRRSLAMRGLAVLASMAGAGDPAIAGLETRLRHTRGVWRPRHDIIVPGAETDDMIRDRLAGDHDDAIVEATIALARRRIAAGGGVEEWVRAGDSDSKRDTDMRFDSAKEIDLRLAKALVERIKNHGDDRERMLEDLERVRAIDERSRSIALGGALTAVLEKLPEDDPGRETLAAELVAVAHRDRSLATREGQAAPSSPTLLAIYDRGATLGDDERQALLSRQIGDAETWHLPPPFETDWRRLTGTELIDTVARAVAAFGGDDDGRDRAALLTAVAARASDLPCYPGFTAVEILVAPGAGEASSLLALLGADLAVRCNGTSPPIHKLNATGRLDLSSEDAALAYLRFFCAVIHGEHGPFNVVSSAGTLRVRAAGAPIADRVAALARPPEIVPPPHADGGEDVAWAAEAVVLYGNVLFTASFGLKRGGMVEMVNDNGIASELPVLREASIKGWRRKLPPVFEG